MLPVPIFQALVAAIGLEAALGIAGRIAAGTPTPADNALVDALGVAVTGSAIAFPAATASLGTGLVQAATGAVAPTKRRKRKKSAYNTELKRQIRTISAKSRTKSGKLRKGVTQSAIMKRAHRATRAAMKAKGGKKR